MIFLKFQIKIFTWIDNWSQVSEEIAYDMTDFSSWLDGDYFPQI